MRTRKAVLYRQRQLAFAVAAVSLIVLACPVYGAPSAVVEGDADALDSGSRFVDNGDGTITDTQTGLIWEKKLAGSGCLHCVEDFYPWEPGLVMTGNSSVFDWLSKVNSESGPTQPGLAGHSDWRLPSRDELWSLVDCGFGSTCIDPSAGPTSTDAPYWTFTTLGNQPSHAWKIGFLLGLVYDDPKNFNGHVRAVRGGAPVQLPGGTPPRYIDNLNGTVTDTDTGLMWEKKVGGNGCPHCVNDRYAWEPGLATSANQSVFDWLSQLNGYFTGTGPAQPGFAGYSDWRLPSRDELASLVECANGSPCVDPVLGSTGTVVPYWTSTSLGETQTNAWLIGFGSGLVYDGAKNVTAFARAVRGGVYVIAPSPTLTPTASALTCVGDCDGTGEVTISELLLGVNIALGAAPASRCAAFDTVGDGKVTVAALVRAVGAALTGCPTPTNTPAATAAETNATPSNTVTPTPIRTTTSPRTSTATPSVTSRPSWSGTPAQTATRTQTKPPTLTSTVRTVTPTATHTARRTPTIKFVRFVENHDGTVTDNGLRGLMWEKLSDDQSPHDWNNTYTLEEASSSKIAALNRVGFAGYTDWRLPEENELAGLVSRGNVPTIDVVFSAMCAPGCTVLTCSCTQPGNYWTASSYAGQPLFTSLVNFGVGASGGTYPTESLYVRAVRGVLVPTGTRTPTATAVPSMGTQTVASVATQTVVLTPTRPPTPTATGEINLSGTWDGFWGDVYPLRLYICQTGVNLRILPVSSGRPCAFPTEVGGTVDPTGAHWTASAQAPEAGLLQGTTGNGSYPEHITGSFALYSVFPCGSGTFSVYRTSSRGGPCPNPAMSGTEIGASIGDLGRTGVGEADGRDTGATNGSLAPVLGLVRAAASNCAGL